MCGGCGCRKSDPDSEWQLANFGLNHDDPNVFALSMWCGRSIVYVLYRWVWAIYFLSILILSLIENDDGVKWLIWLTYWGYLVLTLNVSLQALLVSHHYWATRHSVDVIHGGMPIIYRVTWVLNNITITTAPVISVIYWAVVYTGKKVDAVTMTTHSVNLIYVTIDMLISGFPVRLLHVYQPMIFGATYSLFTAIYWAVGGTNSQGKSYIYTILDYENNPELAVACDLVVAFLILPTITFMWWAVYRTKLLTLTFCCIRRRIVPITGEENSGYASETPPPAAYREAHII